MQQGAVVWWDVFRGYGFLVNDAGEQFFCHNKAILGLPPGKRNLKKRERVTFEIGTHGERVCAINVRRVDSGDSQDDPLAMLGAGGAPNGAVTR